MQVLGLYIDPPYIHLAVIEKRKNEVEVRSIKNFLLDQSANVKQLYIPAWKGQFATAIHSLVRFIELPQGSAREIAKGIPFKVESLSPLPLSQVVYFVQSGKENNQLFVVSKEKLQHHLQIWHQFGIQPDLTTSIAQAQLRFFQHKFPSTSNAILIHLGSNEWNCLQIQNHQIVRAHTIPVGINDLLHAFWEDRKKVLFESEIEGAAKQIDLLQLRSHLNPSLSKAIEKGKERLSQALSSFIQNDISMPVLFTGRVDAFHHLKKYLTDLPTIGSELSIQEALSALAVGIGIENFSHTPIQFLTGEFYPKRFLRRMGRWAFASLCISILGSLSLAFIGSRLFTENQEEMATSLQMLLNRSENGLGDRLFKRTKEEGFALSAQLIQQSLMPAYFLTNHYSVGQFLQKLTSHPLFDSIKVKELEYEMISYPKIGDEKAPYKVKIQMVLETENNVAARKFHETLLSGEWIADSAEEIRWDSSANSIVTSFTLRSG